ncbi:MAG TPA: DUF2147 domain-containing protein [Pseudomonadales bacterium]|nr:DUF2147 domain-containing protein [Pseudomonadales bacterium]
MIRFTLLLTSALAMTPAGAGAHLDGCWISAADDSVIELSRQGDAVRGRVVGLAEPVFLEGEGRGTPGEPRVDLNNPDIELRARALAGLYIVDELRRDGDAWEDGAIYDPRTGKSYSARAELDADGTLRIRGYVGLPMFGITTRWTSADTERIAALAMIDKLAPYMPADAPPPDCFDI